MQINRLTGLIILICMLAISCGRHHDPRLERIWDTVSDTPRDALKSLDSIDAPALSKKDRAFYNLLTIKAKDKAYIRHTSDSLILTVIDYYTRHQDADLYPEALYYAGRVYSDLGDYPTALRYFQDALDLLPEGTPNLKLRGNVLSQTGGLLNDLGLPQQAMPYIEGVLKINHQLNDTLNLAFDYKALGAICMQLKDYERALKYFVKAEKLAAYVSREDMVEDKIHQAAAFYYKDDIENALKLIRTYIGRVDSLAINYALSFASKIYLDANILDTAYLYARQLTLCPRVDNKKTGYMVMLSPELRQFVPKDSLETFFRDYKLVLEKEFIQQQTNATLIQNSMYNYRMHEKKSQEAERSRMKIMIWLIVLIAIVAILAAIILYIGNKNKGKVIELHEALAKIKILEQSLSKSNSLSDEKIISDDICLETSKEVIDALTEIPQKIKEEKALKLEMREKLKSLNEQTAPQSDVCSTIIKSRPYIRIQSLLKSNKGIADDSSIWVELENVIQQCFPEFKSKLQLLSDGDLNAEDFHIALLLKCGFSLKQLAALLSVTKPAITYRRKQLSIRLFGEALDLRLVDNIIRSL